MSLIDRLKDAANEVEDRLYDDADKIIELEGAVEAKDSKITHLERLLHWCYNNLLYEQHEEFEQWLDTINGELERMNQIDRGPAIGRTEAEFCTAPMKQWMGALEWYEKNASKVTPVSTNVPDVFHWEAFDKNRNYLGTYNKFLEAVEAARGENE